MKKTTKLEIDDKLDMPEPTDAEMREILQKLSPEEQQKFLDADAEQQVELLGDRFGE